MAAPQIHRNLLDRAIEVVAPQAAARRLLARTQLAIAGQWIGARTDRKETAGWVPFAGSADADNLYDLDMLRRRSRDMQRGEPLATGAINTVVTNVIATGLVLRSTIDRDVLRMSAEQAVEWQRNFEREFRLWAHSPRACDTRAQLNFYGQQTLGFRSELESGDVIALLPMIPRKNVLYDLKVQLIEADRLCNPDGRIDTDQITGGIERDEHGAPVAYHILRRHPGAFRAEAQKWDRIPAFGVRTGRRNVIHPYEMTRPEQSRGMPYLAPVIEPFKTLGKYTNAELQGALINALFTVLIKSPGGLGIGLDSTGGAPTSTPKSGDALRMGSGSIIDLAGGEDAIFADPKRPNQAFDPFVLAILRQMGAALELPFEVLVKHFTASYTAARAALLQAIKFFIRKREHWGSTFCDPVLEAFAEEAILKGRILAPGFFDDPAIRAAYLQSEWIGDAFGLLDPLKEAQAVEKWLQLRLTSRTDEAARNFGSEWDTTIERLAHEDEVLKRYGFSTGAAPDGGADPLSSGDPSGKDPANDDDSDLEDQ